jgi:outer membrane cobalamin receptor
MLSRWQDVRARGEATRSLGTLEIRRRKLQSVQEAVRILAPDMVGSASGASGSRGSLQGRRSATVEGPRDPLVVIDGVRAGHRPEEALASLSIDEVERVDVSTGSAAGWRYGPQGVNGVIEITTRVGVANALALGPSPGQCGFAFPPAGAEGGRRRLP